MITTLSQKLVSVADGIATNESRIPTSLKQVGVRRDYQMIDPQEIAVEQGHNPRDFSLPENRAHIENLKASIRNPKIGLIQPLTVRFDSTTGKATLVDGQCRLTAILELIAEGVPFKKIACFPAPDGSNDPARRLLTAITANDGKPFSKWELGEAFRKLHHAFGWELEEIAKEKGISVRFISEAMELAEAPEEVKQLLSQEAVTPSLALATLRTNGAEAAAVLKQKVEVAKSNGQKTAKRDKSPSPAKEKTKDVASLVLYAAEAMAVAIDGWLQDATAEAETKLVAAHKAYRKLIRAPKRAETA